MIKFENVSKKYEKKDKFALKDVNININRGEFVFLVGSSGAGKSTFIKLLLREEIPSEGTLTVNEKNVAMLSPRTIPRFRRNMGVVFQDFRLLPNKTVYENIAFAMEITQQKKKEGSGGALARRTERQGKILSKSAFRRRTAESRNRKSDNKQSSNTYSR